ncbi:PI-PLC domain-containing protein [Glycomyces xiaoerkulensis]|uniref:hypothetical protein n=1 Tax=Glycomyces xiaoerkulensis TaxID=2038139 RepID=UPI000C261485|nr:hypothetical protein [Glycomyces xiaoerkulensis]
MPDARRRTISAIHQRATDAPHLTLEALGRGKIGVVYFPSSHDTLCRAIGAVSPLSLAELAAKYDNGCDEPADL